MTIDEYILSHSDEEGALLSALNRDANVNLLRPRMLSGHLQGRILKMFCRMLRPRRVLEIGYGCISAMPSILSRHSVKPSTLFLSMPTSGCIRNISTLFSRWCVPAD